MTRRSTNNLLQIFPDDVRRWLQETARREETTPEIIVRERMRELAEHERVARTVS